MENHVGTINFMPAIAPIYRLTGILTFGISLLSRYLSRLPTTFLTQVSAFWWHSQSAHARNWAIVTRIMCWCLLRSPLRCSRVYDLDGRHEELCHEAGCFHAGLARRRSGNEVTWDDSMFNFSIPREAVTLPGDEPMKPTPQTKPLPP